MQILVELEPGLPFVYGDYPQLEQVFLNLCLNARDALPQGGEIRLCTSQCCLEESFCRLHPWARPGHYVTVRIEDNGVGMPAEVLERVFEPFFTTKEPGKGTGLGLTIAYSIVKSHQGHILAESPGSSGAGSRFTIFLPALEDHDESCAPGPTYRDEAPRGKGERILLVDDEPQLLEIGKKMLFSHNYRVDTASNGREALGIYARELGSRDPYRLVILDMAMPVMDGAECLSRILEIDPAAKVVVSTGTALGAGSAEPPLSEAAGFLEKPFDLELLLRSVRKALEGGCEP